MAVGLALFLTGSFTLAKTGRDALYLQGTGIYDLPLAYIGMAALSLPLVRRTPASQAFADRPRLTGGRGGFRHVPTN